MQIKDNNGNIIATIKLKENVSIQDLVSTISNKRTKTSFRHLDKIVESEDKKSIIFKFVDGDLFYDLPSKTFIRKNGIKIGKESFNNIRLGIKNKVIRINYRDYDNFWNLIGEKTEVSWIKTFFRFIDIWANNKHDNGWISAKDRNRRIKFSLLSQYKKFFDSVESFAKISNIQSLDDYQLSFFYKNVLETCITPRTRNRLNLGAFEDSQIKVNIKKTNIDKWFLERINNNVSENYLEINNNHPQQNTQTLVNYIADYALCDKHKIKNLFQYVFDNYGGAITSHQIKMIKDLIKFGYEQKRLMDYLYNDIYNQGLNISIENDYDSLCALTTFYDYVKMNIDMKNDYEKYPRYLRTLHDITQKNYTIKQDIIKKNKFEKILNKLKNDKLEYSDDEYSIILPSSGADLVKEGQSLSHCVASYYSRMASGETTIVFLRKKNNINQSLVTIEIVNKKIVQAKTKNNANPQKPEMDFIKKYESYLVKETK